MQRYLMLSIVNTHWSWIQWQFIVFILCLAIKFESNISHSSDKTFSKKQTAIFLPQRTASILNTFSQWRYTGKQLRNVTLNKSVLWLPTTRRIGTNAWLCSFQASFCPPVKSNFDPTSPRGSSGAMEWAHCMMPSVLNASILIRDYPTHLKLGERRWAGCQVFFQHRFQKKILQSVESPDFQQFTF